MLQTLVVNIQYEQYDVFIGRGRYGTIPDPPEHGCFGNPFPVKKYGRRGSIDRFVVYFYDRVEQDVIFKKAVLSLTGKRIGCFCKPKECHGDVIAQWLNEQQLII